MAKMARSACYDVEESKWMKKRRVKDHAEKNKRMSKKDIFGMMEEEDEEFEFYWRK